MKSKNTKKCTLASMKQGKQSNDLTKRLAESDEKYRKLEEEYLKLKDDFSRKETSETIEKFLKNQAFGFILTEGLLERFLDFRKPEQRTKTQDAIYTLVLATDPTGFWID